MKKDKVINNHLTNYLISRPIIKTIIKYSLSPTHKFNKNILKLQKYKTDFKLKEFYFTNDNNIIFEHHNNIRLVYHPDIVYQLFYRREKPSLDLILNKMPSNGTFIDIGANIGEYSLVISKNKNAISYAFEPVNKTITLMKKNVEINNLNNKIKLHKIILSDNDGSEKITTNLFGRNHISNRNNKNSKTVKSQRLDSFIKEKNMKNIDFIKIDVEGAEIKVLKGAIESIKKFKPKVIIEINNNHLKKFNSSSKEIFKIFNSLNYKCEFELTNESIKKFDIEKANFNITKNYYFIPK